MNSNRELGRTFVEVIFAAVILATTVMLVFRASDSSTRAQHFIATKAHHDTRVGAALDRLTEMLRQADASELSDVPDAPATSSSIRFRRVNGYAAGGFAQWGAEEHLSLRETGSEAGSLLLSVDGVDERILRNVEDVQFSRRGRMLKIVLNAVVEGPEGRSIRVVRSADVCMRN